MDFEEFAAVYKAYATQRDADFRDRWERMRLLACITIQPHIDTHKERLTPEKLLPFPWDKKARKGNDNASKLTAKQQRQRMKELVEKLGDKTI